MAKFKEFFALLATFNNIFLVNSFSLGLPHVNPGKTTKINKQLFDTRRFQHSLMNIVNECNTLIQPSVFASHRSIRDSRRIELW